MYNIASDRQDFVHFLEFFSPCVSLQAIDLVSDFDTKLRVGVKPLKIHLHKC